MRHKNHQKQRLYARNQLGSKQWTSTEIFLCSCGAVLATKEEKVTRLKWKKKNISEDRD